MFRVFHAVKEEQEKRERERERLARVLLIMRLGHRVISALGETARSLVAQGEN